MKGTKPSNMPRFSKKRTSTSSPYRGISHHKICVVSSIDENAKLINADSASAYQEFCKNNNLNLNAIPSGFHSNDIFNISEINGIYSHLGTWLSKFRGVSIRHLQEYLDWFVYIFTMKKRFKINKIKTESYSNIIIDNNYIKSSSLFNMSLPIDLDIAYAEYKNQS